MWCPAFHQGLGDHQVKRCSELDILAVTLDGNHLHSCSLNHRGIIGESLHKALLVCTANHGEFEHLGCLHQTVTVATHHLGNTVATDDVFESSYIENEDGTMEEDSEEYVFDANENDSYDDDDM